MGKPTPAFEVYAPGVFPEKVPLHALSKIFAAVQKLASGSSPSELDLDDEDDESVDNLFGLLSVNRGSSRYGISNVNPEKSLDNIRAVGRVLNKPDSIGDREFILGPIDNLSGISKALKSPILLREPGKDGQVLVSINPDSYENLTSRLFVRGESSLFGEIIRVGGATGRKCAMRISNRSRLLHCKVQNQTLARQLGQKMYEKVTVYGMAEWLKTTWSVIKFNIKSMKHVKRKNPAELIESLRSSGGDGWDEIKDPVAFLNEMAG